MAITQDRLKFKRVWLDAWSNKEKLALIQSVRRNGDQNWTAVSRFTKQFSEKNRPSDWFSIKNCAAQYKELLRQAGVSQKRKKRGSVGGVEQEMDSPILVFERKLIEIREVECRQELEEIRRETIKFKEAFLGWTYCDNEDCKLDFEDILEQIEKKKKADAAANDSWLRQREERMRQIESGWRPNMLKPFQWDSSVSDAGSSEPESPASEPLAVDITDEHIRVEKPCQPVSTPTSPLLTSLLKSPAVSLAPSPLLSPPSTATASILHSAITSPLRSATPTIASLLNSSTSIPPSNMSPMKNLPPVGGYDEAKSILLSPSQGATTLARLLDMPPSMPGTPLPVLQSVVPTIPVTQAPPPYVDHLGPPPPYPLAKEYLQKQRAEALQAQQDALQAQQAILNVEKELIQATMGNVGGALGAVTSPLKPTLKSDDLVNLEDIEEVIAGDSSQYNMAVLTNTPDHDYNLIKPRISDILPEPAAMSEMIVEHIADLQSPILVAPASHAPTPTQPPTPPPSAIQVDVERKHEKKQLDVFEFGEEEDNVTKISYSSSVAKRLAEKEAKMSSPVKVKHEEQLSVDAVENLIVENDSNDLTPKEEAPNVDENSQTETIFVYEIKTADPPDVVKEEIPSVETIVEKEVEESPVVDEEDEEKHIEIPEAEDSDTKDNDGEQSAETSDDKPDDVSVTPDSAPRDLVRRRRGTLSLSVGGDSLPNSPLSLTDEEKEHKAWKKSVLIVQRRIEGHKSASLFLKPIADEEYTAAVKRSLDLSTIKRNIESGLIRTTNEYKRDIMLMFLNARMYNKVGSVIYSESTKMEKECLEHIKMLYIDDRQPAKRELRVHEKGSLKRQGRPSLRGSSKRARMSTSASLASDSTPTTPVRK